MGKDVVVRLCGTYHFWAIGVPGGFRGRRICTSLTRLQTVPPHLPKKPMWHNVSTSFISRQGVTIHYIARPHLTEGCLWKSHKPRRPGAPDQISPFATDALEPFQNRPQKQFLTGFVGKLRDERQVSLRRHPVPARQEQDTISTTPSIRHVAQPPAHTTTAKPSRRLNNSSRIVAFGTPSKQRPVHASSTSAASPAPPSVRACAAPILVGATLDRPRAAASGGVHALA